jgi:hypothetical protein
MRRGAAKVSGQFPTVILEADRASMKTDAA